MNTAEILAIISVCFGAVAVGLCCVILTLQRQQSGGERKMDEIRKEIGEELRNSRTDIAVQSQSIADSMGRMLQTSFSREDAILSSMETGIGSRLAGMDKRLSDSAMQSEMKLENMRATMEKKLAAMQEDNARQLTEMRATVDEKLQKSLDERIGQSFRLVSERLEMVYTNLGEMKALAEGVGDLKKVLTNVKTRGIYGELQLGAILEQMLSPEQYETNVVTKAGTRDPVEFAVKLPGEGGEPVYLPIDSKFPLDVYENLLSAYDTGDRNAVSAAASVLVQRIRQEAKKIHDKYVDPPRTTDFAVMFLPIEGLYAEVVRCGLVDRLQQDYRVSIAGPTTMSALLNSLQMGFRSLAIQKRSSEVWKVLGEVRTEFDTFGKVLEDAQSRIVKANEDLDKLIGVRTRQIQKKLKDAGNFDFLGPADAPALPGATPETTL